MFLTLKKYSQIYCLILYLFNQSIFSEGFVGTTLIRLADNTYKQIDELTNDDLIISYDFTNKILIKSKIQKTHKKRYNSFIKLTVAEKEVIVAPDHKFYFPLNEKIRWIKAKDLHVNDFILINFTQCARIEVVESINQEKEFYSLSVDKYQNYFVTENNIFVHNEFVTLTASTAVVLPFVFEAARAITPALIFGGWWLGKKIFGTIGNTTAKPSLDNGFVFDDSTLAKTAVAASTVNGIRILYKKMTNKEAREEAKRLQMKEIHNKQRNNNGKGPGTDDLIFERSGLYYSPDRDQHGGSIWKLLDRNFKRIASCDKNLEIIRK